MQQEGKITTLQQQMQFKSGVAYLVPNKWWTQFCRTNTNVHNKDQLIVANLNLQKYVDNFLIQFQEGIVAELEHKANYLKLHRVVISPQRNRNIQWSVISSQVWHIINNKIRSKFGILTMHYQHQLENQLSLQQNQVQIQIIFCSKTKSQAFVGFLPSNTSTVLAIRNVGYQLGFIEMANSRISYPDVNPEKGFYFFQLEQVSLQHGQDSLFLVYNLQCTEEKQAKEGFSFGKNEELGNSNEAVAGDMGVIGVQSFEQVRNNRTMSTGAETPSFFASEEENHGQFRVRELFRQKKPEQIKELRIKANKIMYGQLTTITERTENQLQGQLQLIEKDLLEHIHSSKKKTYKDKQIYS